MFRSNPYTVWQVGSLSRYLFCAILLSIVLNYCVVLSDGVDITQEERHLGLLLQARKFRPPSPVKTIEPSQVVQKNVKREPITVHAECPHTAQRENADVFENWLKHKTDEKKRSEPANIHYPVTLRVVFHVIHDGEQIGIGSNLDVVRFRQQINILNKDFRNTNGGSGAGVDTEIQFSFNETLDIMRYDRSDYNWLVPPYTPEYIDDMIKPPTTRLNELYLNIWVLDLDNLGGYATFPMSSTLNGIDIPTPLFPIDVDPRLEGVVVNYIYIGYNPLYDNNTALGHIASHEVGHYLGLRHIWGDGDCSASDYCDDTPPSNGPSARNSSCAGDQPNQCAGQPTPQVQNYMDYSNLECQNMFTEDQKQRMHTVLEYSPRRTGVIINAPHNVSTPTVASTGLAVLSPVNGFLCLVNRSIIPAIRITNNIPSGGNNITSITLGIYFDDVNIANYSESDLQIPPQYNSTYSIDAVTIPAELLSAGRHEFNIRILAVNGESSSDVVDYEVIVLSTYNLSSTLNETFSSPTFPPEGWQVDPSFQIGFVGLSGVIQMDGTEGTVAAFENYKYHDLNTSYSPYSLVYLDGVYIPPQETLLEFEVAYAEYSESFISENLLVLVYDQCNFDVGRIAFDASGKNLSTADPTQEYFSPTSSEQWRKVSIPFDQTMYDRTVFILFKFYSKAGNNIFLDNIGVRQQVSPSVSTSGSASSSASASLSGSSSASSSASNSASTSASSSASASE